MCFFVSLKYILSTDYYYHLYSMRLSEMIPTFLYCSASGQKHTGAGSYKALVMTHLFLEQKVCLFSDFSAA